MLQSVMPVPSRVLVPDVLPAVMPAVPAVPEFLPAAPAVPVLPLQVPADLPAPGRGMLAAAPARPLPGAQRKAPGETVRPDDGMPLAWDDAEMKRFLGFLRSMSDRRDPRGRRLPLDYLTAVAVAAGVLVAFYGVGPGSARSRRQLGRVFAALVSTRMAQAVALAGITALALASLAAALSWPSWYWPTGPPGGFWHFGVVHLRRTGSPGGVGRFLLAHLHRW